MYSLYIYAIFLVLATDAVQGGTISPQDKIAKVASLVTQLRCKTEGYTHYASTGSCYKLHKDRKNWDDANASCQAEGGHLLVINDANEADVIKSLGLSDLLYTYVGLRDYSGYGGWKSVDGKNLDEVYNVWEGGRPALLPGYSYHCGVMLPSGKLDNYSCTLQRDYICEM